MVMQCENECPLADHGAEYGADRLCCVRKVFHIMANYSGFLFVYLFILFLIDEDYIHFFLMKSLLSAKSKHFTCLTPAEPKS